MKYLTLTIFVITLYISLFVTAYASPYNPYRPRGSNRFVRSTQIIASTGVQLRSWQQAHTPRESMTHGERNLQTLREKIASDAHTDRQLQTILSTVREIRLGDHRSYHETTYDRAGYGESIVSMFQMVKSIRKYLRIGL